MNKSELMSVGIPFFLFNTESQNNSGCLMTLNNISGNIQIAEVPESAIFKKKKLILLIIYNQIIFV